MLYADKHIPASAVADAIAIYQAEARHPDQNPYVTSDLASFEDASATGQAKGGVYLIFRDDRTLIYIGMSLSNIAGRIGKHLSARVQESPFWQTRPPALAQVILVPNSWEAPSLEEYLVQWAEAYPASLQPRRRTA